MRIRSKKLILFLVAILSLSVGTILGLVPGIIALDRGIPIAEQLLIFGGFAYACSMLIAVFIRNRFEKKTIDFTPLDALRVVAIDDEADILRPIRMKLSEEGSEASTAPNGDGKHFTKTVDSKPSDAIRVVAIDDEADILRLIRMKLTKEGFEVSTASNGDEAIDKVLRERPDVMIVDIMMPGKDGYQVVSEVKAKLGEDSPVTIMLTSKTEDADMVRGLTMGADDYITKPFSPRELIERVNVALIKGVKGNK